MYINVLLPSFPNAHIMSTTPGVCKKNKRERVGGGRGKG